MAGLGPAVDHGHRQFATRPPFTLLSKGRKPWPGSVPRRKGAPAKANTRAFQNGEAAWAWRKTPLARVLASLSPSE